MIFRYRISNPNLKEIVEILLFSNTLIHFKMLFAFIAAYATIGYNSRAIAWFPGSTKHSIGQNAVSFLHTIIVLALITYGRWTATMYGDLSEWTILFSMSFFAYDSALIYVMGTKNDWIFLAHHMMTIIMLNHTYEGIYPLELGANILLCAELSNVCIYPFSILRENRNIYKRQYEVVSIALTSTYVPARTIGLSLTCIPLLSYLFTNNGWGRFLVVAHPIICLMSMSWLYSIKMLRNCFNNFIKHRNSKLE